MYKSLEDLMAGIYEMAAPDGIICNEVSKFLAANQVKPEDISSGIWFFLWLKSAPKDAKPIQKEIPGFGVVLNMPTYGGTLNEAITGLIENECRQIELAEGHPSLEAWVESVLAGRDDGEENEAAANIVDLLNGCHDLLDTAIINYLSQNWLTLRCAIPNHPPARFDFGIDIPCHDEITIGVLPGSYPNPHNLCWCTNWNRAIRKTRCDIVVNHRVSGAR